MYVWLPASTTFTDANGFSISQENPAAPWAAATGLVAKPDLSKRDQWQRIWGILSSSLTGTGLPTFVFRLSATTGGVVYFTMFQIEHGAFPSTFMPSDGFYYSRFGDDFVVPSSAVSGFKTTEGTLLTYNGLPYTPAGTDGFRTVFSLNNPTDRAVIFKMPTVGGEGHVAIGRDSVTQYSAVSSGGFWLASTPKIKNVLSWKTTANAYINGVPFPNSGIAVLPPIAANEFHVGTSGFMLFKEIAYWPKHISNAELIRLTTP
jgi:hypothetical protein